jgi:hypothetical protein
VAARLESVHPVLMSSHIGNSVQFYERLGFAIAFQDSPIDPKYAAIRRDGVELHLQRQDQSQWTFPIDRPTYRFLVRDLDGLYHEFRESRALESNATSGSPWLTPADTPWGTREFHVCDPDGNGLQFYRPI